MTRSKNMIIKETIESTELYLFAINESCLKNRFRAVCENLNRYSLKGTYDHEKAIDAFYPVFCEASKLYAKYFASDDWRFSVSDRFTAAAEMVEFFENDFQWKTGNNFFFEQRNDVDLFNLIMAFDVRFLADNIIRIENRITVSTYKEKQSRLRDFAIQWQLDYATANNESISWSDCCFWGNFFEKYGARFGLLSEFKENAIC